MHFSRIDPWMLQHPLSLPNYSLLALLRISCISSLIQQRDETKRGRGEPAASVTVGLLQLPAPLDELQVLLNWLVSKRNKYLGEEQLALAHS